MGLPWGFLSTAVSLRTSWGDPVVLRVTDTLLAAPWSRVLPAPGVSPRPASHDRGSRVPQFTGLVTCAGSLGALVSSWRGRRWVLSLSSGEHWGSWLVPSNSCGMLALSEAGLWHDLRPAWAGRGASWASARGTQAPLPPAGAVVPTPRHPFLSGWVPCFWLSVDLEPSYHCVCVTCVSDGDGPPSLLAHAQTTRACPDRGPVFALSAPQGHAGHVANMVAGVTDVS